MDTTEITLKVVMTVSTLVLFMYGLFKGYDTLELSIYNLYFVALIIYLLKTNLLTRKIKNKFLSRKK
ncbi:MAG: hypothetical protein AB1668_06300 [Nanoarchaeota archaeon]